MACTVCRPAVGTAAVGGVVSATALAIFFVPVFFVTMLQLFQRDPRLVPDEIAPAAAQEA